MTIKVLLADDHPVVRAGLKAVLEDDAEIRVVAEASTAEEAFTAAQKATLLGGNHRIDVVLMDLRFGDQPGSATQAAGVEATKKIRAMNGAPQVLVVTNYSSDADVLGAVSAGAVGYLLKDSEPDVLTSGVKSASRGESVLSQQVANRLMGRMQNPSATLTPREHEVLALVGEGLSNREIAKKLVLTEATVKSHLGHAFAKLNVTSRTAAIVAAKEQGIL